MFMPELDRDGSHCERRGDTDQRRAAQAQTLDRPGDHPPIVGLNNPDRAGQKTLVDETYSAVNIINRLPRWQ
jgi:hypothetical protein